MATIDKDLLLDKIDRLLKLHNYAREDWFANAIHNTVWDAPEIETDGETIYRADAIETVRNVSRDLIQDKCMPLGCATDFTDALSALQSAEAVQGEWKRVETRTYKGECTNCGFRHIFMDGHDSQYRFCPYCGADMRGGGDNGKD